jgi:hypothetical protein
MQTFYPLKPCEDVKGWAFYGDLIVEFEKRKET